MGLLSIQPAGHTTTRAAILPLVVRDLCYEIGGKRLLDNISFRTDVGSRTVVLGPNGAGKSLLLRLCHGLLQPSAGTITWAGAASRNGTLLPGHGVPASCAPAPLVRQRILPMYCACKAYHVDSRRAMMTEILEQAGLLPLAARPARVPVRWGAAAPCPGACLGPQAPGVVP